MTLRIAQTDDIVTCLTLRRSVFIDEQGVSEADEIDDLDEHSVHLLAWDDDHPVGTARLHITKNIAKIGRVCVVLSHRGTGLGAALIGSALDFAKAQKGVNQAKLGAQVHALGFYEALGFEPFGPVYDDAGIDHRDMVHHL